ncbi:MAG: PTS sugar transporter subunit IIB [Gemmatimonadaceae bacterium]|nr:PTS sugar transporter subunit IIB [Gemmatimonadaceae bacterium]
MPLEGYRVDDRLVHGQVVVGWGQPLDLAFLVVVDDALAESPWEQELYKMAAPPELQVSFRTVSDAAAQHAGWASDARPGLLLTADVDTMARLVRQVPAIRRVTLGGLHAAPGRKERLTYVFLDPADHDRLQSLASEGVEIVAQDVPGTRPAPLAEWIGS